MASNGESGVTMDSTPENIGYGNPPKSSRFQKGRSGNPKGRPRKKRSDIPYDGLLGQMVTIREDGRERRVTAAEAFVLHLTKRGLEGDSAAARASLAAIETARATTHKDEPTVIGIVSHYVSPGAVGVALDALGMAKKLNRYSELSTYKLQPWIVQAALKRLGDMRLTPEEQSTVLEATRTPEKVSWPDWWLVRPR